MDELKNNNTDNITEFPFCPINPQKQTCETVTCLTQQHANEIETLLSIQQAITSQLNLGEVLQMIADEARRLTSAKISFLYVLEDNSLSLAAYSGLEDNSNIIGQTIPVEKSLAGKSILTGKPYFLIDVKEDDPRLFSQALKPFGNITCYLTVPLIYRDHSIGVIAIANDSDNKDSENSLRVLSMLAPSAVIGIENARLYQEQQERRLEAEGRHQMSESLRVMLDIVNSNRSLDEILNYIVSHVSSRLTNCQATAIFSYKLKSNSLVIQAAHGLPYNLVEVSYLPGYDVASQAFFTRQPVSVSNAQAGGADDQANIEMSPVEWAVANQLMVAYQAWLAVPLIIKGETYGAILMYYDEPHIFSKEEVNLAIMFSDQVALTIENARLRIQEEQAAVSAERSRLARELHDAVSQTLFSANLIAEVMPRLWEKNQDEARKRLEELRQLTKGAFAEMRTLLFELRPAVFKEAKLGDLLKQLTQSISIQSQIPISLEVTGERMLPAEVQIALYRITQEALNNVVKHANPKQASVTVEYLPQVVTLTVSDDGGGFNPQKVSYEHFGLSIMQERAASIDAIVNISSNPGNGTHVKVIWADIDQKEPV